MTNEKLYEVLGDINEKYVKEAREYRKAKKPVWLKWGAMAACLCLVVVGFTGLLHQNLRTPGSGGLGGEGAGGGGYYSVAVYPASEKNENVATAEVVSLTENEVVNNELSKHLPKHLPDGFHYGRGSIYNTVMKDGTQYHMLRVEYISGTLPEQQFAEDGGAIAPNLDTTGDIFTVCVMNYEPETEHNIYSSTDEVTVSLFEESGSVCISLEDYYISIFAGTAAPEAVFEAVKNIE